MRAFLFSFQTKLVLAITAVILLTITLAGSVFVVRSREDQRQHALERVAAASPAIYQQAFYALLEETQLDRPFADTLEELAREQDVRILILAPDDVVLFDTDDRLGGQAVSVPRSTVRDLQRGFVSWEPGPEFPEQDLTFVSASITVRTGFPLRESPFRIVLAVETKTITGAWLDILPGLLLAALVAVPLSAIAGVVLARQVAQPVRKLTLASEALARGDFSQRVAVDRDDELGRLARSFTTMTERVGERDAQMRALLANVSHDLKTPMTSITGYAQSLTDGTAGADDIEHAANVIREEAEHVNTLLADLLYLGEIDAGQVVTRHEDVPLAALVERCVRRIDPVVRERGLTVTVEVPADVVLEGIDPEKVERALTNVLENAAKFTPPGGKIDVRGSHDAGSPAAAQCVVTNTGSSIPEQELNRIFDRFYRGDRARRTAGGSGLGLSIARELTEMNRGSLQARNVPAGVAFTFAFPA